MFECTKSNLDNFIVADKLEKDEAEREQIRQERQQERHRAAALQRAGGDKGSVIIIMMDENRSLF